MGPDPIDTLHALVFAIDSDLVQESRIIIPRASLNASYMARVYPILSPDEMDKLEKSIQDFGVFDQEDFKPFNAHTFIPESESHRELMIVFEVTVDPKDDTITISSTVGEKN